MTEQEGPKRPKLSPIETLRLAGGPYRRVFHYVKPYKWRFILGLALQIGVLFGVSQARKQRSQKLAQAEIA